MKAQTLLLFPLLLLHCTSSKQPLPGPWYAALPDCPCQNPDLGGAILGDGWAVDAGDIATYHSGAAVCYRSYPAVKTQAGRSGQQCCYDEQGRLITGGAAAGTPDKASTCKGEKGDGVMKLRLSGLWGHYFKDVRPWQKMGGENGGWKRYNRLHPPNNGRECPENEVSVD